MSSNDDSKRGICILSLDSGGPGTYSQLLILKEYMSRLASDLGVSEEEVYAADYFDLIGGVGFGGLVAIMLGLLRMSIDEAIAALVAGTSTVFPEGSPETINQTENSENLKAIVAGMLSARDIPLGTKMWERNRPLSRCKVVVYAATSTNITHPHVFRSYSHRGSSLNPTIIDAVCATLSIPSHFSPAIIGPQRTAQSFIGGPLGANNPTRELLTEASTAVGNETRVAQIISIGCGAPHLLSLEETTGEVGVGRLLKEMAADCQMVAKDLSTRLCNVDGYLRLNVQNGLSGIEFDDWSTLGDIETHTRVYIGNATVSNAVDASLHRVRTRVGTITLGRLNLSSSIKVAARKLPSVSTHFVVRTKPLGTMVDHLVTLPYLGQRIFAITGMGGCGKTQMVAYFLQEHPLLYNRVVVIDASSSSSIEADYQAWAREFGEGHEQDVWEDGLRILSNVPQDERWALILDNADDPSLNPVSFIPTSANVTVIITSRNPDLGNLSTTYHLELGEMEPEEGLETLLHSARRESTISPEEMESARTLAQELGYLALALVQAGTYCHQLSSNKHGVSHPYTFIQYLSIFYKHRTELMKNPQPFPLDRYEHGVYTTLDLSYQAIPQLAREFLHFISFFHHIDIPLAALAAAARNGFMDQWSLLPRPEDHERLLSDLSDLLGAEKEWNEFQVQEEIRKLRSFSLISATSINDDLFLQMHPLVQAWSRDKVSSNSQHYRAMVVQVLTSCTRSGSLLLHRYILPHTLDILGQVDIHAIHVNGLMGLGDDLGTQGYYRKATGAVEAVLDKMKHCEEKSAEKLLLVTVQLATLYWKDGRWEEAEKLQIEVLEQQRRVLGMEHPDTIRASSNLAATYHLQGRWSEAEKLEVEVLEKRRRVLGMEHPDTIQATANLAVTYHSQGRWSEAEKLEVEVLEKRRRVLGMEHPDTIRAAANLAATYRLQGRWSEAEKLEVEVLEKRRRVLGMEHPETIWAAANLASTYHSQGRWSEAEKLKLEVLEQQRRVMGMEHPDTIGAAANLAATYHSQGRWSEAEKLEVEVLEKRRRVLGMEHPDTIRAAANLGATYRLQGRWSEAEKLEVEVLEKRRRVLGMEHPDTIGAAANLAATYRLQGRWSEAEKLEVEVLEKRRRVLGMEHPDTIQATANLAGTYRLQGRWSEAEKLEIEVLEQRRRVLGMEHPDTIRAAANLAVTYDSQGRWSEAEKLEVEVLEKRRRVLGMEHPDTIRAAANLAATYHSQGRWSEAEKLKLEVLEQQRRVMGMEHPHTIGAAANLAATNRLQGRWSEAEKLEVEVLEKRRRVLGMEHPDTIRAAANLAATYHSQGRWSEAEKLKLEVLEQQRRVMGMEHPDTIRAAANLAVTYDSQGRWSEAEKLEVEVLEKRRRVLGMEHPDTIGAAANLASTYDKQGRLDEAANLLVLAVDLGVKVLGRQHPHTQQDAKTLVHIYKKLGKQKEAQEAKALLLS